MSTRRLIFAALICGMAILVAVHRQLLMDGETDASVHPRAGIGEDPGG